MPKLTLPYEERISISHDNIKMKAESEKVFSLSFPPIPGVCHRHAPCFNDGCYADRMYHRGDRKNIRKAWDKNLRLWQEQRELFVEQFENFFAKRERIFNQRGTPSRFRSGVGGDLPDWDYLLLLNEMQDLAPSVPILAFTKRHDLLFLVEKEQLDLTFQLIWSDWPCRSTPPIVKRLGLPIAYLTEDPKMPPGTFVCPTKCEPCGFHCWDTPTGTGFIRH